MWPALKPLADALRAAVAAALGDAEFAQATALGAQMRLNEALAFALDSTSPSPLDLRHSGEHDRISRSASARRPAV